MSSYLSPLTWSVQSCQLAEAEEENKHRAALGVNTIRNSERRNRPRRRQFAPTSSDAGAAKPAKLSWKEKRALNPTIQMKQFEKALLLLEGRKMRPAYAKGYAMRIDWSNIPEACWPRAGGLKGDRAQRKRWQIENMAKSGIALARAAPPKGAGERVKIVEFCGGSGFLCLPLAALLPDCDFVMIDMKEKSVDIARRRLAEAGLTNVTLVRGRIEECADAIGTFDVGLSLHACGEATDISLDICVKSGASYVMCPCCVGKLNMAKVSMTYPRSRALAAALDDEGRVKDMYKALAAAADYGGRRVDAFTSLERRRRTAKSFVEMDRNMRAAERGYETVMYVMEPRDASPKNDVIVGVAPGSGATVDSMCAASVDGAVEWLQRYDYDVLQNDPKTRDKKIGTVYESIF